MTAGPPLGPASAYPTLRRPASTCFSDVKDVFAPGLAADGAAGRVPLGCALADPSAPSRAAAIVMAAAPRRRRRPGSMSSLMTWPPLGEATPGRRLIRT